MGERHYDPSLTWKSTGKGAAASTNDRFTATRLHDGRWALFDRGLWVRNCRNLEVAKDHSKAVYVQETLREAEA